MLFSLDQIKAWAIEQVMRDAVVARLDEMIKLPFYLEWLDDKLIGILVDLVCGKLNQVYAHHFADAKPDIVKLAHEIALPEEISHEQR